MAQRCVRRETVKGILIPVSLMDQTAEAEAEAAPGPQDLYVPAGGRSAAVYEWHPSRRKVTRTWCKWSCSTKGSQQACCGRDVEHRTLRSSHTYSYKTFKMSSTIPTDLGPCILAPRSRLFVIVVNIARGSILIVRPIVGFNDITGKSLARTWHASIRTVVSGLRFRRHASRGPLGCGSSALNSFSFVDHGPAFPVIIEGLLDLGDAALVRHDGIIMAEYLGLRSFLCRLLLLLPALRLHLLDVLTFKSFLNNRSTSFEVIQMTFVPHVEGLEVVDLDATWPLRSVLT